MARFRLRYWIFLLLLVAVVGGAFVHLTNKRLNEERQKREKSDDELGLDAARTVSEVFSKNSALQVATLNGEVLAIGRDRGWYGLLPSSMTIKYPYSVKYAVDLQNIGRSDFRWSSADRTMIVTLPDVVPQPPTIDIGKAVYVDTSGIIISANAAKQIIRQAGARAQQRAKESATNPKHLNAARKSAEEAIIKLIGVPLRVAGLGQVNVIVRYPWEGIGAGVPVRWDESSALSKVFGNAAR